MRIATVALLATAGAIASGGIALASAQTGSQPAQPGRVLPTNAASPAQQHAGPALAQHPSGNPSAADPADPTDPAHPTPHGTPTPSLIGLCHAWLAGAGSEHGKARNNPAFSVLVLAAGGSDGVDGYCTTLLGSSSHPAGAPDEPKPAPSHPGPTAHPGNTDHPGKSDHPGRTSHPGRPSNVPPVTPPAHP